MRKITILLFFASFVVTGDFGGESAQHLENVIGKLRPSTTNRTYLDTRLRKRYRIRKRRCRRYSPQYYHAVPQYVHYQPPRYVIPQHYVPPKLCPSYCYSCPTVGCRRRCPMDVYPLPPRTSTFRSTYKPTRTTTHWRTRIPPSTWRSTRRYPCNCDPDGAQFTMCNVSTGTCVCKAYYTGKTCDKCMDGFWKNNNKDCVKCACTKNGTKSNTTCHKESGKCDCKDGVTGQNCDACLPDHYGNIESGCKKCDPCDKKGHICDPNNGRCVCPPLTKGKNCQDCVANAWGHEPGIGCKDCNCSRTGSSKAQCDGTLGRCTCKLGYEGEKCDRCSFGYFNYPSCQKCSCAVTGTREDQCQNGLCACGPDGSCKCKENVEGATCDRCKAKTYGLTKDNVKGCTNCFCFGRSDRCGDAHFNWDKIRLEKVHADSNEIAEDILMLPSRFLGDLTTSYGGYISVSVNGGYFQAYIQGHGVKLHTKGNNEIQVVETSGWKIESYNDDFPKGCREVLSRDCFMVVLQDVTMFTVEAKNGINEVLLDKAKSDIPSYPVTHSIEKCECPTEYAGLSCQDPNEGYFRYLPNEPGDNWIDLVVGRAKICECNGRSRYCDPVSGHCKHCGQHTTGDHCDRCDIGYYKDQSGNCAPCLCPTAEHNNAESCSPTKDSFVCKCKQGYTGRFCDQCSIGFYDNDTSPDGMNCIPCGCNLYGVVDNLSLCDAYGKCTCKDGFKSDKCNECVKDREYIKDGLCTPCDECTQLLFDEIDKLGKAVEDTFNVFRGGITPPWKILTETMKKHSMLSDKFEERQKKAQKLLENANIDEVEARVNDMEDRVERNEEIAEKQIDKMDDTYSKSSKLLEDADKLNRKLLGIVKTLNGFGTKQVDLKEALYKAQTILDEMRYISGRFDWRKDEHALEFCSNVTRRVEEIYKTPPTIPQDILEQLKIKLNDLVNVTSFVESKSRLAEEKNLRNSEQLVKVKAKIEKLKSKKQNLTGTVDDIVAKIEGINEVMEKLEIVYEDLKKISDFPELKTLENRVKRQEEASVELEELYEQALEHVQQLEEKINSYRSIFNFTKDEWQKINASGAYEAIVMGIKKAKDLLKSSQDTLEKATKIIEPVNSDGLVVKANLAYTYSDRLEQRINNIKDISKNLSQIKNKLDTLKYSILQNGKSNNDLTQILHKMELEITSHADRVAMLEEAIVNSTQVSENMREMLKKVDDMHFQKEYLFFKQYQNFLNLTNADEINILKTKLSATRRTLQNLNITSTNLDTLQNFNNLNKNKNLQSIHEKIRGLQNKINYAKQAANMVNVAMNLNNCRMSYNSPKPEFFESLSVTFKCKNCKLFKWSNKMKEVLALKVENYKPILTVENKDIFIDNTDNRERTVNVERTGSLMKIRLDAVEKSKKVTFDDIIDPDDVLQIGSIDKISDGYIFKVLLNENNFGLWKFTNTEGSCIGQKRDTLDKPADYVNTYFNGEGYRVYGRNNLVPTKLTLSFYFNTFDENSLIYLAKDDVCAFIALYIKNGLVYFHVVHNNGAVNLQKSDRKYNDGKRYQVTITMKYDNKAKLQHYNLVVTNTNKEQSTQKVDKKSLHQSNVFKIKLAEHYIGGVPPTFNASCVTVNTTSFLGFLDQSSQLTNEKISFGVTKLNKKVLEFSHAWINRNGHISLNLPKEKLSSLGFILRPDQPNGVVLRLNELQYLYLSGYKLHVSDVNLTQNFVLNKNDYNSVQLTLDRHKTLTVNGVKGDITLQGKVKTDLVQIGDTIDGFSGGIREITINNKIVSLNWTTVSEVSNADIGREKPPIRRNKVNIKSLTMTNFTNSMQNTEGCSSFGSYVTDPDAVKYGDKPNSYTHVKTNFWRTDYKLQFDFRTLYTNGVIFVSLNQKNQHYILLEVKEGKLYLSVNGKRRREPIFFNKTINDGKWHGVQFVKKKRKLTVIIDNEQRKPFRIPKNRLNDEIYLGGVPFDSEYLNTKDLRDKLLPFRGCLRSLIINDENKVLIKNNQDIAHSNIRQCFPNIEEGAYFGGDAYAVYKADFRISKILELSFEFRTGEQNGILLSVSNHRNTPSLSVQLQNGGVVMAVDAGNGVVTNVTNNLDSEFALCNNRWHNVTAMYSAWELTVNVDGIRKSWVQSDVGSIMDDVEEPLYIGGVPDNAPLGTLKTRENFKGCMRKLKIDDKLMDWSDMQDLNNVMLNSCPVDNSPNENLETTNYRLIS